MLAWLLAMASFGNPSVTILQEATRGTLEQLHLTPYRTWKIMFSRIVSQLLLKAIMAFLLIVIIQLINNQWLIFNPLLSILILSFNIYIFIIEFNMLLLFIFILQ